MKLRTVLCICLSAGLLLSGCAKGADRMIQQVESTGDNTTSETLPPTTGTAPFTSEAAEENTSGNVKSTVQLYEGTYFDEGVYRYVDIPDSESPFIYCEIQISNITDTSFDFAISEIVMSTGESTVIFPASTAFFTGDGSEATYEGKDQTLHFEFPHDQYLYPIIRDMKITGLPKLEGNTYINNNIPGHEAG